MKKYYLGLDIGTDSVGFAVTDENYNLIRKGKKDLWGIRLFDDAKTAVERRVNRANRRRLSRRKERLELLKTLFDNEINKIDDGFFLRLQESMYHFDDKTEIQYNSLFNDENLTDKDFFKNYKTIYHLRSALIKGEVDDVRMLYLGISHILKTRGHFLFDGIEFSEIHKFDNIYNQFNDLITEYYQFLQLNITDVNKFEEILKNSSFGITAKDKEITKLTGKLTASQKHLVKLLIGGSCTVGKLFEESIFDEEIGNKKICFKKGFDEVYPELQSYLGDDIELIDHAKAIYDWAILTDILNGNYYLSDAKVADYETHQKDLKLFKELVKKYIPEEFYDIFTSNNTANNYSAYVGSTKINGKKAVMEVKTSVSTEDFCAFVFKKIANLTITESKYQDIILKIQNNNFLQKQRVKDNSVIPMQVHKAELLAILENNKNKFQFLSDSDGKYTVAEKIKMIFEYRIPYYVGPLNKNSAFAWIERMSNEKITPWNFSEVVNVSQSAENFITRMTNDCTYVKNAHVLPKSSILYSKFMVLNEINNLKINGEDISLELKQGIYNELFLMQNKVTRKQVISFIKRKTGVDAEITGIDGDFKSNMKSYLDFKTIFGEFDENMADDIIKWITLFSEDKKMLKAKITSAYKVDDNKLNRVSSLKYSGFGKLSKEFLTDVLAPDQNTGEAISIITALYETNMNLMQLLSNENGFKSLLDGMNNTDEKKDITYKDIENLYCSPSVKKSIWQSVLIVKEIEKIMGNQPTKLFVETTRGPGDKGKVTKSRHKTMMELYKSIKKDYAELYSSLEKSSDNELRIKKVFLYYSQLGRCAYTGKIIDLNDLMNNNLYDIEHIYPRSKTKDDSIHNNLVLVSKIANLEKTDHYPIPSEYRQNDLWKTLSQKKLITPEKYKRLTRTTPFEEGELRGFIARQLVETSQATKAVAEIFRKHYTDTKSEVCYVRANHVSDFRKEFDLIKCRDVNDYHHAKDAYLNIVVGNVFNTKFTKKFFNKANWTEKYTLNTRQIYNWDTKIKHGETEYFAWKTGENCTIKTVKDVMSSNKILFTRKSYNSSGSLYKLTILKKNHKGKAYRLATKMADEKLHDLSKYGSYGSLNPSSYCLIECVKKNKTKRMLISVPIYIKLMLKNNENALIDYIKETEKLDDFKIIFKEIKTKSLVNVDGFLGHLSGGSDMSNAVQLMLSYTDEIYIKEIFKSVEKNIISKIITPEDNLRLYDILLDKYTNTIYKKSKTLSNVGATMNTGRDKFTDLDINNQCIILKNLVSILNCRAGRADLKLIGGSSEAGRIQISLNISDNFSKFELINQSITGIFENKIDLLK